MKFDTYLPCDALKPYVKSFVISENSDESTYKVLPDTGLVIGFQYKGRLSQLKNDSKIPLDSSGLTGLHDSFRIFTNSSDTSSVLVYFKEAGAAPFFKQPIHELFRESVSLDNFILRSELLILEEQLCEAKTDMAKISVIEQFLISRLKQSATDNLVLAALSLALPILKADNSWEYYSLNHLPGPPHWSGKGAYTLPQTTRESGGGS